MEVISNAALAQLHPTSHHPESPRRLEVLLDAVGEWRACESATVEQVELCHTPEPTAGTVSRKGLSVMLLGY